MVMWNCRCLICLMCMWGTLCMGAETALQTPPIPAVRLLDGQAMAAVKARIQGGAADLQPALNRLCTEADAALNQGPVSVMDKQAVPPSGDRHDYMSMGPYWWPNPDTVDGLPYIRRDGHANPEREQFDYVPLGTLTDSVHVLSLAYYLTDKQVYAAHAATMIRTWFLDEATRMNPNLTFGQHIPGITEGRGIGLIETRRFVDILEDVSLLAGSNAWQAADARALKQWFSDFLTWMLESKNGQDEAATKNNHGSWYDVQVAYYALFTGRDSIAQDVLGRFAEKRLARHIEPDGSQPYELDRTKSYGYSVFNLEALFAGATLARDLGIDLWHWSDQEHGSLQKALDYLMPHTFSGKPWPHTQIVNIAAYRERLLRLLSQAAIVYPDTGYERFLNEPGESLQDTLMPWMTGILHVETRDLKSCIGPAKKKGGFTMDGYIHTNDGGEAIALFTACLPLEGLTRVVAQPVGHYYPGN